MADPPTRPLLLDQVRDHIRLRHYSIRTEQAYLDCIRRFIPLHGKDCPGRRARHDRFDADGRTAALGRNQSFAQAKTLIEPKELMVR